jgi:tetratricopeptide (TPR) repeat protein
MGHYIVVKWARTDLRDAQAQRAIRLSPFDTSNSYMGLAIAYLHSKNFGKAPDAARRAVKSSPALASTRALHAVALVRLGLKDEAVAEARRVIELDPTFTTRNTSTTVRVVPEVFRSFADTLHEAGIPSE